VSRQTWRRAGEVTRALRALGESVPLLDVVIGVARTQERVALWTSDRPSPSSGERSRSSSSTLRPDPASGVYAIPCASSYVVPPPSTQ
jgi:hypothetical protein